MYKNKFKQILIFLILISVMIPATLLAQEERGLKKAATILKDRFPSTRLVDIEYQTFATYDFKTKLHKQDFQKGQIKDHQYFRTSVNIPLIRKQRWSVATSLLYKYETFDVNKATYTNFPAYNLFDGKDTHYIAGSASFSYFSSLWGKPLIYNASLTIDGSHRYVETFKVGLSAIMVLNASKTSRLSIGAVTMYDSNFITPFVPVLVFWQQLGDGWSLDLTLPQRIYFVKDAGKNGRLTLGSDLRSNVSYFYPGLEEFDKSYYYREIQLRTSAMYEHRWHSFILYSRMGVMNVLDGKMTKTGKTSKNHILSTRPHPSLYFNVGISFNP